MILRFPSHYIAEIKSFSSAVFGKNFGENIKVNQLIEKAKFWEQRWEDSIKDLD